MRNAAAVSLHDVYDGHVLWWQADDKKVVRYGGRTAVRTRGRIGGFRTEPDGSLVLVESQTQWHPSFRYFRLSQSTDDMFNAYRNMYLAIESLLSDTVPRQQGEREGDWLLRCLTSVGSRFDLSPYVLTSTTNPAQQLYDDIWTSVRNNVFHAKAQSSYLPHDPMAELDVAESLLRHGMFFVRLVEDQLGVRHLAGGMAAQFGADLARQTLMDSTVWVTDDSSAANKIDTAISPQGRPTVALGGEQVQLVGSAAVLIAETSVADIEAQIPEIRRWATTRGNGSLSQMEALAGPLVLEGADDFQVVLRLEFVSSGLRRSYP